MPKRKFTNVQSFNYHVRKAKELIFDGTENPVERPQDADNQRSKYSGKKGTHTDIMLLLSDKRSWIYYVSELYDGCNVDMGILKKEFPPEKNWFKKHKVIFDLGFVGVDKIYKIKNLVIGKKRPYKTKKNPDAKMSEDQKQKNTAISRERIYVEHAIGRMKKFRILKNRCRYKCIVMKNRIIGICAGLANYDLIIKHSLS